MKKSINVVYFGGSVGVYLDGELFAYESYAGGGMENLFNRTLELMTKEIERVEKLGISDESEFWDNVNYGHHWIPPLQLESFKQYCQAI